jgi:hypothetical protein
MRIQGPATPQVRPQSPTAQSTAVTSVPANAARAQAATAPAARSVDRFDSTTQTVRTTSTGTAARARAAANLPAEVQPGTKDYYRQRHDDFVRRNPGMQPPPYYLEYGNKYLEKFSSLGPKDMSPEGLAWRDNTLKALQVAIETKRMEDPVGFAQLERDPEAFKRFAYDSHPDAYVKSGFFKLPMQDMLKVASTVGLKELLGKDGIPQILATASQVRPKDVLNVAGATLKKLGQDLMSPFRSLIPQPRLSW